MYYEIIYESGEHSIANYENDEEALLAINEHVRRAKAGEPATPASTERSDLEPGDLVGQSRWPAQRVAKVLVYEQHPATYSDAASNLTAEVAVKTLKDVVDEVKDENNVVNVQELAAALLETTAPRMESGAHESNYKMKEARELEVTE